jgi:uncharacterized protein involved in outer membrane biogenesis
MKKWLLAGAALIAVLIAVLYFGLSNLGPLIKTALNTYGPQITRTTLHVGDVGLSLFAGEAHLKDFLLGNPKGFSAPEAVKVGAIDVDLNEKTLADNPVVIDKVEVRAPEITYEKSAAGDNFQALLQNVRQAAGAGRGSPAAGGQKGAADTKLVIRSLVIRDGRINLTAPALAGQHVTTDLPYLEIQDLGGRNGATPEALAAQILTAVYRQIQSPDVTAALAQGLKTLGVEVQGLQVKVPLPRSEEEEAQAVKGAVKSLLGD